MNRCKVRIAKCPYTFRSQFERSSHCLRGKYRIRRPATQADSNCYSCLPCRTSRWSKRANQSCLLSNTRAESFLECREHYSMISQNTRTPTSLSPGSFASTIDALFRISQWYSQCTKGAAWISQSNSPRRQSFLNVIFLLWERAGAVSENNGEENTRRIEERFNRYQFV